MWPWPQRGRANSTPDLSEPALDSILFCNFRDMNKDVKGTVKNCFKIQNESKINLTAGVMHKKKRMEAMSSHAHSSKQLICSWNLGILLKYKVNLRQRQGVVTGGDV